MNTQTIEALQTTVNALTQVVALAGIATIITPLVVTTAAIVTKPRYTTPEEAIRHYKEEQARAAEKYRASQEAAYRKYIGSQEVAARKYEVRVREYY